MNKIILWIVSCCISFIAGIILSSWIDNSPQSKEVMVTQLSGEKIEHKNFDYTGKNIQFKTEAQGKGQIQTQIPKDNIPEAFSWLHKNHGIQLGLLYYKENSRCYSLSYIYRYRSFAFGGGPIIGDTIGVNVFAQYWFSAK